MTNSTSTDITFGGAWRNRVVANQGDPHSTVPADKQINEYRYIQPPPYIKLKNIIINIKIAIRDGSDI